MLYAIFNNEADALALCAATDAALGLPWPGVAADGHADPAIGPTLHWVLPMAHPDGTRWAVACDSDPVRAQLGEGADVGELDDSWFPAPDAPATDGGAP